MPVLMFVLPENSRGQDLRVQFKGPHGSCRTGWQAELESDSPLMVSLPQFC